MSSLRCVSCPRWLEPGRLGKATDAAIARDTAAAKAASCSKGVDADAEDEETERKICKVDV